MIVREPNQLYAIREKNRSTENNSVLFRWRYKSGTHFLITLCNALKPIPLSRVVELISQEFGSDRDILTGAQNRIYSGDEDMDLKVFFIREKKFQKDNRTWSMILQELNKRIPYRVDVYVCEEEEDGTLSIYDSVNDESAFFLPLRIRNSVVLKTKGVLKKQYYAEMRIDKPEKYEEGTFRYLVPAAGITIPIPEMALGRPFAVKLPDSRIPMIFASEEYRNYYSIEEI